jgi:hypothetical protein
MAEKFMPHIMVLSSDSAILKMKQNGLTPAEFLRPFGNVGNLGNISLKTIDKHESFKLSNFRVNFIDSFVIQNNPKLSAQIVD